MKKTIIFTLLMLPLMAQAGFLGLGFRAGLSLSQPVDQEVFIIPDGLIDEAAKLDPAVDKEQIEKVKDALGWNYGISAGIYYDITLIPGMNLLNIRPELSFVQKKAKYPKVYTMDDPQMLADDILLITDKGPAKFVEDWKTAELNYFEIVLPVVVTLPLPGIDIYALGGGFIGFLMSSKDAGDNLNSFEYGYVAGAGFGLDLMVVNAGVEGRYERNLSKIWEEGDDSVFHAFLISLYLEL